MIKVVGPNPLAYRRIEHHAPKQFPIANAIMAETLMGWIGQDDNLHTLYQSRPGMASFALHLNDGRQYHFRQGYNGSILVKSSYMNGKIVADLDTEDQARHFIRKLKK